MIDEDEEVMEAYEVWIEFLRNEWEKQTGKDWYEIDDEIGEYFDYYNE